MLSMCVVQPMATQQCCVNNCSRHTWTKPMEGGPKSLKAGLKLDDEGREGEGTEEPGQMRKQMLQTLARTQEQWEAACLVNHTNRVATLINCFLIHRRHLRVVYCVCMATYHYISECLTRITAWGWLCCVAIIAERLRLRPGLIDVVWHAKK